MGRVVDILLCTAPDDGGTSNGDHPNADLLSKYLVEAYGEGNELKRLDQLAVGSKTMETDVFGVSVNYCDVVQLLEAFRNIKWKRFERAQLLIRTEDCDIFRSYPF